jgi:hypothetical protein
MPNIESTHPRRKSKSREFEIATIAKVGNLRNQGFFSAISLDLRLKYSKSALHRVFTFVIVGVDLTRRLGYSLVTTGRAI